MISVQDAVNATLSYVKQFENLMPSASVRLEEFKYEEGLATWYITLSFADPPTQVTLSALGTPVPRAYKTFTVDGQTGQVVAMKIRNPLANS